MLFRSLPLISAAHFIVGWVNNASDGTPSDGQITLLWNPANGIGDNLTDIIGPSGNSGSSSIYMIDCELLNTPCSVGDEVRVKVINNGSDYITGYVNISVTGAGFDVMPNLTLNSPPVINNISVDDIFAIPTGEIDLTPASTTEIICEGIITEYDGNSSLENISAEFFDTSASFYGDGDDNNYHYTNDSCYLDLGYGNSNEAYFNCSFNIEYYSNSGNWNCTAEVYDNLSISGTKSNNTNINTLLALSMPSIADFGIVDALQAGSEIVINVTNAGNVKMNLSLSGYAVNINDGNAMNCTMGSVKNISIDYAKYNLTSSTPGNLNLSEFEGFYTNLTSSPATEEFNLNYRQNDAGPGSEEINQTYWRIYVPGGVSGSCTGNIVFGAVVG